jgi:hypothetical protein
MDCQLAELRTLPNFTSRIPLNRTSGNVNLQNSTYSGSGIDPSTFQNWVSNDGTGSRWSFWYLQSRSLCYGNHAVVYAPTATPTVTRTPQATQICVPYPDDYANEDPIAIVDAPLVGTSCYTIGGVNLDLNDLPAIMIDAIHMIGFTGTLPSLIIPDIELCLDRYAVAINLLGVNLLPFITAAISLLAVGSLINELRS